MATTKRLCAKGIDVRWGDSLSLSLSDGLAPRTKSECLVRVIDPTYWLMGDTHTHTVCTKVVLCDMVLPIHQPVSHIVIIVVGWVNSWQQDSGYVDMTMHAWMEVNNG